MAKRAGWQKSFVHAMILPICKRGYLRRSMKNLISRNAWNHFPKIYFYAAIFKMTRIKNKINYFCGLNYKNLSFWVDLFNSSLKNALFLRENTTDHHPNKPHIFISSISLQRMHLGNLFSFNSTSQVILKRFIHC